MLHGMVFKKEAEGDVSSVKDARIAVYSCPFDCTVTETKVICTGASGLPPRVLNLDDQTTACVIQPCLSHRVQC